MSSISLKFEMVGDRKLESIFDELEQIPDDFRPVFEQMAEDFWEHEKQVFDEEGPGWRPLSRNYAAWKEQHYPGQPILVRTGALRDSLTTGSAAHSVYDVRAKSLTLGTDLMYGVYHQTGNIKADNYPVGTHPPQRKVMTLPDSLQTKWNRRMVNWLREEVDYRW